jgi:ubiquinone/menaquinone biosynthesis C-methylase UbiE
MEDGEEVVEHYESIREEDRIATGFGQLELMRTREILRRHLPDTPSRILDVGGATGVHASWLTDEGHSVHVIDITPRHIAKVRAELGPRGVTAELGDARELPCSDDSFDVALVFGPLYHLTDRSDRIAALREARRVVRSGGVVAGAGISRFASLFDGLARKFLFDADFKRIVERDLREGQHRNPENRAHWFTTAFFHHPDELRAEVEEAGLTVQELLGVEGLAGWLSDLAPFWSTEEGKAIIVFAARAVEAEPSLLGLSAHLLIVTRVPQGDSRVPRRIDE